MCKHCNSELQNHANVTACKQTTLLCQCARTDSRQSSPLSCKWSYKQGRGEEVVLTAWWNYKVTNHFVSLHFIDFTYPLVWPRTHLWVFSIHFLCSYFALRWSSMAELQFPSFSVSHCQWLQFCPTSCSSLVRPGTLLLLHLFLLFN